MTQKEKDSPTPAREARGEESNGWEAFAEEASGGSLQPSEELEQAMREAADAVEDRQTARDTAVAEAEAEPRASEELEQTKERLVRLAADFENFRRRALKDREEAHRFGHENLVKDLLPTVDNLERAIDHVAQSQGGEFQSLLQGVELVLRELEGVLAKHGVTAIEAENQPFDPSLHEAMAQAPDPSVPPNTVVRVFQRGYRLRDRLLRPARVVVSCPPDGGDAATEKKSDN